MLRETSQSILEWGDATFGKVDNPLALVTRAREELTELEKALADDDANGAAQEAADVSAALEAIVATDPQARVLICGSLYLAGAILRKNG